VDEERTSPDETQEASSAGTAGGGAPPKKRALWPKLLAAFAAFILLFFVYRVTRSAPVEDTNAAASGGGVIQAELMSQNSFVNCSDCHQNLDRVFQQGEVPALPTFTHDMHFQNGVSDCAACHPANTHEPDKVNTPTMTACYWCHGEGKDALAPGKCETCHPPGFRSVPSSHLTPAWLKGQHGEEATADRYSCTTCHEQQSFCENCHGLAMPHPAGWKAQLHVTTYFETGMDTCASCHQTTATEQNPRDFCDTCHHPKDPKDRQWVKYHPEVVKDYAQPCFQCHAAQTCKTCHISGEFTLSADAPQYGIPVDAAGSAPTPVPGAG
jgi:hypothetical protein